MLGTRNRTLLPCESGPLRGSVAVAASKASSSTNAFQPEHKTPRRYWQAISSYFSNLQLCPISQVLFARSKSFLMLFQFEPLGRPPPHHHSSPLDGCSATKKLSHTLPAMSRNYRSHSRLYHHPAWWTGILHGTLSNVALAYKDYTWTQSLLKRAFTQKWSKRWPLVQVDVQTMKTSEEERF